MMSLGILAQEINNTAFGWGTCSDEKGAPYQLDGGWRNPNPKSIVLYASNGDDSEAILDAITNYDIVVLDGSKGDFLFSQRIFFPNICNRSILGRNNARLCTMWYITPELKAALETANLTQYSTASGTGGKLSNGEVVDEEQELHTRQLIIDYTGDQSESYRLSGIFELSNENENIIFRNLTFVGPGSVDVGGSDLLSDYGATHLWVDHCEFVDGMDANMDTGSREGSDQFITISWSKFRYTDRCFSHALSNGAWGRNNLQHITFAYNIWGEGCKSRMPSTSNCYIHLLNNYYNCCGNGNAINIHKNTHALVERNYAEKGVNEPFIPDYEDDIFFISRDNIGLGEYDNVCNTTKSLEVPYAYNRIPTVDVPSVLTGKYGAGATLPNDYFQLPEPPQTPDSPKLPYEQTIYAVAENETFISGTTINLPDISLTYGETGGLDFLPANIYPLNDIFSAYSPGNNVNGDQPKGTFYIFAPKKDGILTIAVKQNREKKLYIEENGIPLPEFNGITLDESHPKEYMFSLPVKTGAIYKLYCYGSKLGFYGFIFRWSDGPRGDVNGDGAINAGDIVYLVEMMIHPTDTGNPFADLNSDGVINEKDIEEIVRIIMTKK